LAIFNTIFFEKLVVAYFFGPPSTYCTVYFRNFQKGTIFSPFAAAMPHLELKVTLLVTQYFNATNWILKLHKSMSLNYFERKFEIMFNYRVT